MYFPSARGLQTVTAGDRPISGTVSLPSSSWVDSAMEVFQTRVSPSPLSLPQSALGTRGVFQYLLLQLLALEGLWTFVQLFSRPCSEEDIEGI